MDIRLECPECHTSYTAERCGLSNIAKQPTQVTVTCMVCKTNFHVLVRWTSSKTEVSKPWWNIWSAKTFVEGELVPTVESQK